MENRTYRAILFDLDGTLLNNSASHDAAYEKLCKIYPNVLQWDSKEQKDALIRLYSVKKTATAYARFCETYQWDAHPEFAEFWSLWRSFYIDSAVPFPNAKETLAFLRQNGYRIGMITNGESDFQRAKLKFSGLLPYFDHVTVSGEVGVKKPQAEIYQLCADAMGVEISQCLFVGDNPKTDIAGAKNAGMDSMLVGRRKNKLKATYKAADVSALTELLKNN